MNITPIIEAAVTLMAAIITYAVIPFIKGKVDAQRLAQLTSWVTIAVQAAEQYYESGQGELKKKYVVEFLNEKGFVIDEKELDNLIESAVYKISGKK